MHSRRSITIRESNHASVYGGALWVVLCIEKFQFVSRNWHKENQFCSSSVKIDYSDYPKSLISRINEVYVLFFFQYNIAKAIFY